MGLDDIKKLLNIQYQILEKVAKGQSKKKKAIENAIDCLRADLVPGYVDKCLLLTYKGAKYRIDFNDFTIGNTEVCDLNIPGPIYTNSAESSIFEVIITYQQGRYWIISNPARPLRDLYIRLSPDQPELCLRAEDSIRIGNTDLQICRFNVGKAENQGTRSYMEDRMVVIQDLNISPKIDMSMFAVMDGYHTV